MATASSSSSTVHLRAATPADIPAINRIFTHYVLNTCISFKTTPDTDADALAVLETAQSERLPFIVAVSAAAASTSSSTSPSAPAPAPPPEPEAASSAQKEGEESEDEDEASPILGYVYATPYIQAREAYRHTVSFSLYCHPSHTKAGVGRALLTALLDVLRAPAAHAHLLPEPRGEDEAVRQVLGIMYYGEESRWLKAWYARFGFREVGRLARVGWKFGRWLDTVVVQLELW